MLPGMSISVKGTTGLIIAAVIIIAVLVSFPGKPRPELVFTDLPGYGYARVPRVISGQWSGFIEPYLKERSCLALCLALVDLNVLPQEPDSQLLGFLQSAGRPFLMVGTK